VSSKDLRLTTPDNIEKDEVGSDYSTSLAGLLAALIFAP
jgi:hypothetical protein